MDRNLSYLLKLKAKLSGCSEGTALLDRCLELVTRAQTADSHLIQVLDQEVEEIRDELALRFGPAKTATRH